MEVEGAEHARRQIHRELGGAARKSPIGGNGVIRTAPGPAGPSQKACEVVEIENWLRLHMSAGELQNVLLRGINSHLDAMRRALRISACTASRQAWALASACAWPPYSSSGKVFSHRCPSLLISTHQAERCLSSRAMKCICRAGLRTVTQESSALSVTVGNLAFGIS